MDDSLFNPSTKIIISFYFQVKIDEAIKQHKTEENNMFYKLVPLSFILTFGKG